MNQQRESCARQTQASENSAQRSACIAGFLFLLAGILGGCASAYITGRLHVPGDAISTAGNVRTSAGLVGIGAIVDLLQTAVFAVLAMNLCARIRQANRHAARALLVLAAIATAAISLNGFLQTAALLVVRCSFFVAAFNTAAANALVLILFDMHHFGFVSAQIVFGACLLVGIFSSRIISRCAIISAAPEFCSPALRRMMIGHD